MRLRAKTGLPFVLAATLFLLRAAPASAHVKWFCNYDVAAPPQPLSGVLNGDFGGLVVLTLLVLLVAGLLDRTPFGTILLRSMDRVTFFLQGQAETVIRMVLAGFFLTLFHLGNIILTPELKTSAAWVPWLQLAIAVGLVSRQTMAFSALGIFALYGFAIYQYCIFHLMDYPIFLGLAAYVGMMGLGVRPFGQRPLDILRFVTALTLMWASVEKWAYPEWTYPLLAAKPEMTFGFSPEFYMRAAGLVEFALAFTLACGPLMRRTSAVILAAMFIGAIFEFGVIDAIGHSAIIAVLFAVIADNEEPAPFRRPATLLAPLYYFGSLFGTVSSYYGLHALIYRAAG